MFSNELAFVGVSMVKLYVLVLDGERPPRRPEHLARGLVDVIWGKMCRWWASSPSARPSLQEDYGNSLATS
jgi:hypothetical protein